MANRINKIISTKANTLYAMKNLIKKASIEEMYILRVEDFWQQQKSSLHRDYGKIWWLQNRCAKLFYAGRLYEVLQCRTL